MESGFEVQDRLSWGHIIAINCALVSAVVLGGWALGADRLVRAEPHHAALVPSTGLSLLLLSLALAVFRPDAGWRQAAGRWAACLVGVICATNVVLGYTGLSESGLDALFLSGMHDGDGMAPGTALGLLLACLGLVLVTDGRNHAGEGGFLVALLGLTASVTVLFGHSFVPDSPYALPFFRSTSELTALLLLCFFAALLLVQYPLMRRSA